MVVEVQQEEDEAQEEVGQELEVEGPKRHVAEHYFGHPTDLEAHPVSPSADVKIPCSSSTSCHLLHEHCCLTSPTVAAEVVASVVKMGPSGTAEGVTTDNPEA